MDIDDLRNLLKRTDDKLSILLNDNIMNQYDLSINESIDLIHDFLNDAEKVKLIEHILDVEYTDDIVFIFLTLSDENLKMQVLLNDNIMNKCPSYIKVQMISSLSSDLIIALFQDSDFCEKYNINKSLFNDIFNHLSSENKFKILSNPDFTLNILNLTDREIISLAQKIDLADLKDKLVDIYNFPIKLLAGKFMSPSKIINLLEKNDSLSLEEKHILLRSLDGDSLHDFFIKYPDFCKNNNIKVFEIILGLGNDEQKIFVNRLGDSNFSPKEIKEIFLTLNTDVKKSIDMSLVPDEYKPFIILDFNIIDNQVKISLDFDVNPEIYRGLDDWFVTINPTFFTDKERETFLKICEICPNLSVTDNLRFYFNWFRI